MKNVFIILSVILLSLTFFSCGTESPQQEKRNMVPEKIITSAIFRSEIVAFGKLSCEIYKVMKLENGHVIREINSASYFDTDLLLAKEKDTLVYKVKGSDFEIIAVKFYQQK